jgi:acetate kinase
VLALNSGSSSLKFGLYQVESSISRVLLSGEAESIGDRQGKFWAKDANDKQLVFESANFRTQGMPSHASGRFSQTAKRPNRPRSGIAWYTVGRIFAAIAWSTKRRACANISA